MTGDHRLDDDSQVTDGHDSGVTAHATHVPPGSSSTSRGMVAGTTGTSPRACGARRRTGEHRLDDDVHELVQQGDGRRDDRHVTTGMRSPKTDR
jgi:hypothetical protein